jgi:hypothetical protein
MTIALRAISSCPGLSFPSAGSSSNRPDTVKGRDSRHPRGSVGVSLILHPSSLMLPERELHPRAQATTVARQQVHAAAVQARDAVDDREPEA